MDALSDQLVRADLVVTSGGVSMGDFDVVKEALAPPGTVWFGGVGMRPGKPQGFGVVGEDETPIFTLPGNPVSSYVSFETFVLPHPQADGQGAALRPTTRALLTHGISSPGAGGEFVRGSTRVDRGGPTVAPVGGHGSHLIGDLASSNALIVVPEDGPRCPRVSRCRCCGSTRSSDDRAGAAASPTSTSPAPPDGRRVRAGRHRADRDGVGTGAGLAAVVALLRGEGVPKGDALGVAAGIMGAKQTPSLIPARATRCRSPA